MSSWQPIETIPMDGSPVLVWCPEEISRRSHVQIANYRPNCQIVGNMFAFDLCAKPTHWMPLPAPPSVEQP